MQTHNDLLARFVGRPALVAPHLVARFDALIHGASVEYDIMRTRMASLRPEPAKMLDDFWYADESDFMSFVRPYVVVGGLMLLPVKGVLLHDFPYQLGSFATGYEYIWKAWERAQGDPSVQGVCCICDSPGGEVAGNFDLVDRMFATKAKPSRAFAAETAFSAAYSIASVCDSISVTRTGGVGSIGVVMMHREVSGALEQAGVRVTYIYGGKHKVDGNPYEPLGEDVKARWQGQINDLYGVFVNTVARNRGMSPAAIRATEALDFTAPEAVSNGLADRVGALDEAMAAFAAECCLEAERLGDEDMATITEKDVDAARAEGLAQGRAEGREAAAKEAAAAMQARCGGILQSEEAKGRESLASHFAFKTSLTVEDALAALAAAPKAAPVAAAGSGGGNSLDALMKRAGNPNVGPDASEAGSEGDPDLAAAERIKRNAGLAPRRVA